jgi:hypothetical protein
MLVEELLKNLYDDFEHTSSLEHNRAGRFLANGDDLSLWYYKDINRFTDVDGVVVDDIHRFFQPWEIRLAIENGLKSGYQRLQALSGQWIELFFEVI